MQRSGWPPHSFRNRGEVLSEGLGHHITSKKAQLYVYHVNYLGFNLEEGKQTLSLKPLILILLSPSAIWIVGKYHHSQNFENVEEH